MSILEIQTKVLKQCKTVTWIQIVLSLILKLKISMKILVMMVKKESTHQIMMLVDHYLTGKNKEVIGSMKDKLRGKIMTEFLALRPKTYSYLMDNGNSDKNVS